MSSFKATALRFGAAVILLIPFLHGCRGETATPGAAVLRQREVSPEVASFLEEAKILEDKGEHRAALALLDSAERLAPDLPDVYFLRGSIYTELNDFEQAQQAFENVLENDTQYRAAWYKLGNVAFLQGQYRRAVEMYEREKELMLGSPAPIKAYFRDVDEQSLPTVNLQLGRAYDKLGVLDSARWAYEEALAADSLNATGHAWLAEWHEDAGEMDEALQHAQRAFELAPETMDHRYLFGSLLVRNGRPEEALNLLMSVIAEQPSHHGANYNMGQAYLRLGEQGKAGYYLSRADTLENLGAKIAEAQAAAYQQPDRVDRWLNLADIMLYAGRLDEAQQAFSVAAYLKPSDLNLQNDMANLAMARGDTTGAINRYYGILAQDSTFADVWLNLGVAFAQSGQYQKAREAWNRALKFQPGHPEARTYLARLPDRR